MAQQIKVPKQTWEEIWYAIDFAAKDALAVGDYVATISSVVVATDDATATVTTATMLETASPSIVGNKVVFLIKGGTSGLKYKITVRITTHLGEKLEEDLLLPVFDS